MREYAPKIGIFLLFVLILVVFPVYWFSQGEKYDYTIQKEEMNVELLESGLLEVSENIVVQPHTMISSIEKDFFPISLEENRRYNCYDCLRDVKVYVDGVESTVEPVGTSREDKNARTILFDPTTRKFTMRLSYTIDSRAVKRYTTLAAFGLNIQPRNTNIEQLKINVKIPESGIDKYYVKDNTTGNSIDIKKINDRTYQITQRHLQSKTQTNFIVATDTSVLDHTTILKEKADNDILNFDYNQQKRAQIEFENKNKNNLPLVYFIIFSTLIYIFLKGIRYKRNYVKKMKDNLIVPYSQTDIKVLPPLASKMISGKSKDFALSLILTLQERGNIGIRPDGTIIYLNDQHLSSYEYQFLKVLFQKEQFQKGDAMTIPELSRKVHQNLDTETCFKQDFGIARDLATEALYKNRIYDKSLGNFMNAFEKYAFVNMIAAFFLMIGYLVGWIQPEKESITGIIMTIFAISMIFLLIPFDLHTIWKYVDRRLKKGLRFAYLILQVILLVPVIGYVITTKECYLLLVIIFAFIHFLLFKFYDEELLTKYGRMEYLRLSGLRHFCRHYYDYEAQQFESHPYFKYYLKYIVAFGDLDTVLPNQTGVLKLLERQLEELF